MSRLRIRLARPEDSAALCTLLGQTAMGSAIRVTMERRPDYFIAARIQAQEPIAVVAEEQASGRLVGVFAAGRREVYADGSRRQLRYLSDLRIHPDYRGGSLLARGFRFLRDEVMEPGEFAQTLILEDNSEALRLLTSGRACLPAYHPIGDYIYDLIPTRARRHRHPLPPGDVRFSRARINDLGDMQTFFDREASRRTFYPTLDFATMARGDDYYRGADITSFWLARRGEEIVAMAGLWDQSAFKQTRICGYAPGLARWRPLLNGIARLAGTGRLPKAGERVKTLPAQALLVRGNLPSLAVALIGRLLTDAAAKGADYLSLGLAADDPLLPAHDAFKGRRVVGKHFLVTFGTTTPPGFEGPVHFECARL